MTEAAAAGPCLPGTPPATPDADPGGRLAALRQRGAAQLDPLRFHFIEALARRAATLYGAPRRLLEARLAAALGDYEERFAQAASAAGETAARAAERYPDAAAALPAFLAAGDFGGLKRFVAGLESLGQLRPLAALAATLPPPPAAASPDGRPAAGATGELKSLHRFRQSWARLSTERQLTEALAQVPENAGPLNSHLLVLRSLQLMRELSPDYLNRYLSYAEALLWLDRVAGSGVPADKAAPAGDGDRKRKGERDGGRKGGKDRPGAR